MIQKSSETLLLPPEARSSSMSRRFVEHALTRWQLDALSDVAVLLTSELVTNAIVHAQTEVAVTITRDDSRTITVAVSDSSCGEPRMQRHSADSATGRGLGILDALASSWDVVSGTAGKTVSFTLRHPSIPRSRSSFDRR
jgi:anti-sigma regulatory factor (Ser/Thr protein kinase)